MDLVSSLQLRVLRKEQYKRCLPLWKGANGSKRQGSTFVSTTCGQGLFAAENAGLAMLFCFSQQG